MKLSWKADAKEGKGEKTRKHVEKQENVPVRETETKRRTARERKGVEKSELGNKKWQIL